MSQIYTHNKNNYIQIKLISFQNTLNKYIKLVRTI